MDKELLYSEIENHASLLEDLSDKIWDYAELSMEEFRSTAAYLALLKEQGFTVTENLVGIPTAFCGSFGSGSPVIGILGEFDALSGLSQQAGSAEYAPLSPGGSGHGCGHNLLGAASLGAAIAIKNQIQAGNLSGTVIFYGCPGEEGCAGKAFMARDGLFRDLDAALCWHPGDVNEVTTGSNIASLQTEYTFRGIASHAAGAPEQGRSALDAAELMNIGVQFLREHMGPNCKIHYSFLDAGGVSPNVVQPTAKLQYMIRGENVREAKALLARVDKIAQGAALMTETAMQCCRIDGTASTVSNHVLEKVLYDNLLSAPLPDYTPAEKEYYKALKATYPVASLPGERTCEDAELKQFVYAHSQGGTLPLNNFVLPYGTSMLIHQGSTDVGDVSWLTPTAQFTAVTWPSGVPGHSWQIVAAGKASAAKKGMLLAAKVLAGAAADLMENPNLLEAARAEFEISTAEGYDCPIGPEVKPYTG